MSKATAKPSIFLKAFYFLGLTTLGAVVAAGTIRAFQRGGNDFAVFYEAWRLVLSNRASEIYRVSPDRYLYGPAFAWLLAPLGLLPKAAALGIWCLGKAAVLFYLIRKLSEPWLDHRNRLATYGIAAWGM